LAPVRDFLDVRDVVRAYLLLLEQGAAGGVYNVASGIGRSLDEAFRRLATLLGADVVPVPDASLLRPADIPTLIGDATRLRNATGWQPSIDFDQTLRDICNAQKD
ncbi:MAG TPA: GDP-mannose 4,6-dehydratase, partial [Gemmatimonadales bacterium]|nr:GDP-mannose 4,6-dehydratase [Gemmatimonadales bacterium]